MGTLITTDVQKGFMRRGTRPNTNIQSVSNPKFEFSF